MSLTNSMGSISLMDRWLHIVHSHKHQRTATPLQRAELNIVSLTAVVLSGSVWVGVTLSTGELKTIWIVALAVAVGNVHLLQGRKCKHFNIINALVYTVFGGLICNALAGLAFFSTKMGVSYGQVLAANSHLDSLMVLGGVWLKSVQTEDMMYYMLAVVSVFYFAQRFYLYGMKQLPRIEVQLKDGTVCRMAPTSLNSLLSKNRVAKFKRSDGWAVVGRDRLRKINHNLTFLGVDRRLKA